ncbi:MAG: beta-galactosidase, partial [Clostridia bacterium]|nr:beta-galactosidase [Clostridia bacterium]
MIYRTEHPKPQFERANWQNLNGEWQFAIDHGHSGAERGWETDEKPYTMTINVPFCPESRLSGIAYTDFMTSVWYRRAINIPAGALEGRVFLHFGAVDYFTSVYLNGKKAGTHKGGYVSFKLDVTDFLEEGENLLVVNAEDDTRDPMIPGGKQSDLYASHGCSYTRTTGIWQTVWLEFTPKTYIKKVKYYPDVESSSVTIRAELEGKGTFSAKAFFEGKEMGVSSVESDGGNALLRLDLAEKHLWELGKGDLYDVELTYGDDTVKSYFGLRSAGYRDGKFYLNGKSVFQRTVLDQGFNPEGIYTAPSDEELALDVDRSMAMGFNGARLHQKVFEERFLYHCDKKGYMVWGEYPNWGLDHSKPEAIYGFLPEWLEEVERDFNHPAIIGWCPFNETWDIGGHQQYNELLALAYHATKAADDTRPCIDTSGNYHVVTDVFDLHDYTQDPVEFGKHFEKFAGEGILGGPQVFPDRQKYEGQPFFLSEYGGIRWTKDIAGCRYGNAPTT